MANEQEVKNSLHPDQFKRLVDSGQSVIFKGNVVNNQSDIPIPSAVELAVDGVTRKQIAVSIDREIADLERKRKELRDAEAAEAEAKPVEAEVEKAPPQPTAKK